MNPRSIKDKFYLKRVVNLPLLNIKFTQWIKTYFMEKDQYKGKK